MQVALTVTRGRDTPSTLVIEAASVLEAEEKAKQKGYVVLAARQSAKPWFPRQTVASTKPAKPTDLIIFLERLLSLLEAGLSLPESLNALQRGRTDQWSSVVGQLISGLNEGLPLSKVMEKNPLFPHLLVSLVRAAETTSNLPSALARYIDHAKRTALLRHQLTAIALYPLLVMVVGAVVVLFLLFHVMPRFAKVFEGIRGELPWSAKIMVAWANALHNHGPLLIAGLLGGFAMIVMAYLHTGTRAQAIAWITRMPSLAAHLHTYFLARWYRTTAMLIEGGIPFVEAIQLANHVLPSHMKSSGSALEAALREGISPAKAYSLAALSTPVAEQLIQAGERTGAVDVMLLRAADFHEAEVTRHIEKLMRVAEPLVMTLVGVGVGLIVILMYLPIFELASTIQ